MEIFIFLKKTLNYSYFMYFYETVFFSFFVYPLESELFRSEICISFATVLKSSIILFNPIKYPSSWFPTSQFFLCVIVILSGSEPVFAKSMSQQLACFRSCRNNKELPMISWVLKNSECSKVARIAFRRWTYFGCRCNKRNENQSHKKKLVFKISPERAGNHCKTLWTCP